jgi:dTDP-4-dehydrorhamnose 3,5-epimerase
MELINTGFNGLYIIKPKIFFDHRGYFFENYKQEILARAGISFNPIQDNESKSSKGVIRGLHYQLKPFDQAKLVRVVAGRIYDVALDLRKESPTFGKWFGTGLDSETKNQLFIPRGFAHGFSVLSETAVIQYKIDNIYNPQTERGINLNDPFLGIDWKTENETPLISDKDLRNPVFKDAEYNF